MQQALQTIITNIGQHVPANEQLMFQKWCQAGQQIMFDPKFHANMELVKNPASRQNPVTTIARGTSGLIWIMYRQSGNQLGGQKLSKELIQVMGFAAVVLMCHAIDFAEQSLKIQFTPEMIGECTKWLVQHLFDNAGITPDMIQNEIDKNGHQQPSPQPGMGPQGQGLAQNAHQQAGSGLLGGA